MKQGGRCYGQGMGRVEVSRVGVQVRYDCVLCASYLIIIIPSRKSGLALGDGTHALVHYQCYAAG